MSSSSTKTGKKLPTAGMAPIMTPPTPGKSSEAVAGAEKTSTLQGIQNLLYAIQETMTKNQEATAKDLAELKQEMGGMRGEVKQISEKLNEVCVTMEKHEGQIQEVATRMEKVEEVIERRETRQLLVNRQLEDDIVLLEMEKSAHILRFQNVREEPEENLEDKMVEMVAGMLQKDMQTVYSGIDECFRVFTSFTRRQNLPREVHVKFCKRSIREEVYQRSKDQVIKYAGKQVVVLRQVPKKVRDRRRNYQALTTQLRKYDVRYKWLLPDGLLVSWQGKRIRIETPEEADEFLESEFTAWGKEGGGEREHEADTKSQGGGQEEKGAVGGKEGEGEDNQRVTRQTTKAKNAHK